jgi:hypothetical protein
VPHQINLKSIAKSLYERRGTGKIVPYEPWAATGWTPSEHECHSNVERFVHENRDCKAVRGWWVFDYTYGPLIGRPAFWRFTAHSVIEDNGRLFDITPSRAEQRYPFIRHNGPKGEFEALIFRFKITDLEHLIE